MKPSIGGGESNMFYVHPETLGKMDPIWLPHIFQRGWNHQLAIYRAYNSIYNIFSLSQWLNFKLFGITYLVGKIKFKLFFSGSIGWVSIYNW